MNKSTELFKATCAISPLAINAATVVAIAGLATPTSAQIEQEPINTTLRYEVALPGGEWSSNVTINPGERVEWRVVISYTGTQAAAALGRMYYQPVLSNVDNAGSEQDQVGVFRQPPNAILSAAEGATTFPLPSYGRVVYGSNASLSFAAHRHSNGSNGAPPGEYIRIAQTAASQWYPPNGTGNLSEGVVSDNPSSSSTTFVPGTQNLVIFRQAFIASAEAQTQPRVVSLFIDPASLQRAGGSGGTDDTRFMTWAAPGEGGSTATIRSGVEYVPATIVIVPGPGALGVVCMCWASMVCGSRRRRS